MSKKSQRGLILKSRLHSDQTFPAVVEQSLGGPRQVLIWELYIGVKSKQSLTYKGTTNFFHEVMSS